MPAFWEKILALMCDRERGSGAVDNVVLLCSVY